MFLRRQKSLLPQSPCGVSESDKYLYKSQGWGGEVLKSDLKYQVASELHENLDISCHPRDFATSPLKFKLMPKN